jgi:site-specific DNA-cytosine methylase
MRMLTVRECLRGQGFREDYKLTGSRETDMKLLGDSVPPLLAKWVVDQVNLSLTQARTELA